MATDFDTLNRYGKGEVVTKLACQMRGFILEQGGFCVASPKIQDFLIKNTGFAPFTSWKAPIKI
jgi:hypothetical protein